MSIVSVVRTSVSRAHSAMVGGRAAGTRGPRPALRRTTEVRPCAGRPRTAKDCPWTRAGNIVLFTSERANELRRADCAEPNGEGTTRSLQVGDPLGGRRAARGGEDRARAPDPVQQACLSREHWLRHTGRRERQRRKIAAPRLPASSADSGFARLSADCVHRHNCFPSTVKEATDETSSPWPGKCQSGDLPIAFQTRPQCEHSGLPRSQPAGKTRDAAVMTRQVGRERGGDVRGGEPRALPSAPLRSRQPTVQP